jgi:hypothetical protein
MIDHQNRSINANIAEIQAKDVVFYVDNIELVDWTTTNQFARFCYCENIHHSSIPRKSIVKAINESPDNF